MKNCALIVFLLLGFCADAQNKFLDYIVTDKNDTIYGTIRHEFNYVLYERKDVGSHTIQYKRHGLKKVKALRYWDKVYARKPKMDAIYDTPIETDTSSIKYHFSGFTSKAPALKDFAVTLAGDTVFGTIKIRPFDKILVSGTGEKYTIDKDALKGYRHRNSVFVSMDKLYDGKKGFLEVLLDGRAKLYAYTATNNDRINLNAAGAYYFIWKDNTLRLIEHYKATQMLSDIFSDNKALQKKILDKEYTYENLYLIVKYYNESQ